MTKDSEFKLGGDAEFEAWRIEMVAAEHNICAQAQYDTLLETVKYKKLCGLSAVDVVTSSDWCAKRVSSDLRHDGANDYKLLFQVSGHSRLTMAQDDTATELGTGDLGLVDVTRQIHLAPHGEPGRWIGLHLPRQALLCHLGFEPKGGLHWRSDAFPARLLLRFLLDAIDENDVIFQTSQAYLQHANFRRISRSRTNSSCACVASSNVTSPIRMSGRRRSLPRPASHFATCRNYSPCVERHTATSSNRIG
jgi:AraC family transcriptional activator of tynA and feaB